MSYFKVLSSRGTSGLLITLVALIIPTLFLWSYKSYRKMQDDNKKPFPFMRLPQELRDMVYDYLVEDPAYPPLPTCTKHTSALDWMLPNRWPYTFTSTEQSKSSNWILLANKQVYREYMDLLCKRGTFRLTVSPQNYQFPHVPSTSSTPPTESIWKISPSTLKSLRSCDLKLITTSSMLGVTDPRNMTSTDWTLARHIRQDLTALTSVSNLTLEAKAIGDPLWNPLWIWYHACQSFKSMGTPLADTVPAGPKLNRITFSLDTWSPGENYLERDKNNKGSWTWYCMQGHNVGLDGSIDTTVREFCGKLYQDCKACRPELESEDWESGEE
ncbi:hypothetical protein EK21DRAFT_103724 [Setomelanomma holmii]|uniref:Uncharacterized protein n=1 Tax=Setomelanomma holmii TaxID=210430 RepID=A0A9P4H190_9PLEO|nr:hypothetical protein EK21DRAFT_103724 [Setomelanomma holmii]